MSNTNDFPSKHTRLQQNLFQKVILSNEKNKNRKSQAGSDFDEQKRRSVSVLDFRLRQNAFVYLSDKASSIDIIINELKRDAGQVVNGLRERTADLHKNKLAKAEADKLSLQLNIKEQSLVSEWSEINNNRLNVSRTGIRDNKPETLEECAEQATKSRQKIIELGHPSQYGSGQLGRSIGVIVLDTLKGFFYPFYPFLFIVIPEIGIIVVLVYIAILLAIAWGISSLFDISFFPTLFIVLGLMICIGGLLGGIFSSEDDAKRKEKEEKRAKLIEGYSAYKVYKRVEYLIPGLYEDRIKSIEDQKNSDCNDAKQQEDAMLTSVDKFSAELGKAEDSFQQALQKIETEFQQEQKELKQEFEKIIKELTHYSKLAIATWSDVFWQNDVKQSLVDTNSNARKGAGEIRIGRTIYPGKEILPMLIDLSQCGHVFIFSTRETEWQAKQLLKAITARIVSATPLTMAKFVFIDTKATGVFSEYLPLPPKMGNYTFSLPKEIQDQTQSLEQHQKRMQGKVGNGDLEAFNLTAKEPEMQRIVCISGFPNPNRFGIEAESHLENIIQSGARVGIHVVLKIDADSGESNQQTKPINRDLCFKHGVVLQPSNNPGQWELCFNGQAFPFVPDNAPDVTIIENLVRHINALRPPTPILPMRVFLCYASEDKTFAWEIHEKLKAEGWIKPWLSEEVLLPGQGWEMEIEKALESAAAVIVFLSNTSVIKESYLQKEFKKVMDIYEEKPDGTIFVIPLRLDECELPYRLKRKKVQWMDYFPLEQREERFKPLLKALQIRYETRPATTDN